MPSRRFAPIGNWPPSCKYLCTASRPVNTTPEMRTSSPTFSARILDSVNGSLSSIMSCRGRFLGDDQSPTGKSPPWPDRNDISRGSRRIAACICPRRSCDNAEIVPVANPTHQSFAAPGPERGEASHRSAELPVRPWSTVSLHFQFLVVSPYQAVYFQSNHSIRSQFSPPCPFECHVYGPWPRTYWSREWD